MAEMNEPDPRSGSRVPPEYRTHAIYKELATCREFYEDLSDLVWPQLTRSRQMLGNLDSSFFDSLAGTIESISVVLQSGRIADAYTLLRRYRESAAMQVYVMHRLSEQGKAEHGRLADQGLSEFETLTALVAEALLKGAFAEDVESWIAGDKSLPEQRVRSQKLRSSSEVMPLNWLFDRDRYKRIIDRCNDHVHLNSFYNLRINSAQRDDALKMASLKLFAQDFKDIFVHHVTHVFTFHPEYMRSSDYVDSLDCGLEPHEGSQYWVSPFVQELFDNLITPSYPEVTQYFRDVDIMEIR